jgi:hypothetical protein
MKYRKKPVVVEAHQWFKNGDHPEDYAAERPGTVGGDPVMFSGKYAKDRGWEGAIVRYYRRPEVDGAGVCGRCGRIMNDHGWIDTREGGHTVCPGDWIITGIAGEHYPCKPDIFAKTYEPAEGTDS